MGHGTQIPGNGQGRMLKFPQGRPMAQATAGGLVLPAGVAAERAKDEASKWRPVMLSWCPKLGAFEVPGNTQTASLPHPIMPPRQMPDGTSQRLMCPWVKCGACGAMHMVSGVLVPAGAEEEGALADDSLDTLAPAPVDDAQVEQRGKDTGTGAAEVFPGLAAFHIQRVDTHGPEGHLAGMVVSAVDAEFHPITPAEGETGTIEVQIDGADKADLQRRIMCWVKGLEAGSGKPAMFGGWDYCRAAWKARGGK